MNLYFLSIYLNMKQLQPFYILLVLHQYPQMAVFDHFYKMIVPCSGITVYLEISSTLPFIFFFAKSLQMIMDRFTRKAIIINNKDDIYANYYKMYIY